MANSVRVVHVYLSMLEPGGVETLLDLHRRRDGPAGLDPAFRMLFDRKPSPAGEERYYNFNFHWWQPVGWLRQKFARVMARTPGAVVVHHNGWGLPFLASADASARRVVILHANRDFFGGFLPTVRGHLDGVLCVSPLACPDVRGLLPELEADRVADVLLPLAVPAGVGGERPRRAGQPLVLGYSGRLRFDQKRVDRIPVFLRAAREAGLDVRFEILGEGWARRALEKALAGFDQVTFHGWQPAPEYWKTLARWDGIISFSDIEGGPISLLEGMAAGAVPFFPRIGGALADDYMPRVDALCYYPPGDMGALAQAVAGVFRRSETEVAALRERARALTVRHTDAAYIDGFADFARATMNRPRVSSLPLAVPPIRPPHWLPLGFVTRAWTGLLRRP